MGGAQEFNVFTVEEEGLDGYRCAVREDAKREYL